MRLLQLARGERVAALCAATLALYAAPLLSPSKRWKFLMIWDDHVNFHENPVLQGEFLFSWGNLVRMASMRRINVYEPLSWLLKALIVQCVGLNSWTIRVVTMVLHFAAGWVLVKLSALLIEINRLLSEASRCSGSILADAYEATQADAETKPTIAVQRLGDKYFLGCCLSGLLFVVHPINIEVVAWPSAQPYALAALFANLSLLFYLEKTHVALQSRGVRGGGEVDRHLPFLRFKFQKNDWLVAAAFFLVDVFVFFKLNDDQLSRVAPAMAVKYIAQKALVLVTMLSFIGVTIWSNEEGSTLESDALALSLPERILKTAMAPSWIVLQLVWPTQLRAHYQLREDELDLFGNPECLLSVLVLVFCVCWGVSQWLEDSKSPQLLLGISYLFVMVLPTSGLIQHGMVSMNCNRYAYFPSAVFVPVGGYLLGMHLFDDDDDQARSKKMAAVVPTEQEDTPEQTVRLSSPSHNVGKPRPSQASNNNASSIIETAVYRIVDMSLSTLLWGIFMTILGLLVIVSTQQMETWRNERNLYAHNLKVDASDWRVYTTQSEMLIHTVPECAQFAETQQCRLPWELSFVFAPTRTLKARLHRAKIAFVIGNRDYACDLYAEMLHEFPKNAHVMNNVGICRYRLGFLDEALSLFYPAAYAPGYKPESDKKNVPLNNYRALDQWIANFRARHGKRAPTMEERVTFTGSIMW